MGHPRQGNNHRQIVERRVNESDPFPGNGERRQKADRRFPQVTQIDFAEWVAAAASFHGRRVAKYHKKISRS